MTDDSREPSMSRKIFQMGLSVEAVSLYLLCCGLHDAGSALTTRKMAEIWNAAPDLLHESITVLEDRQILQRMLSAGEGAISAFRINPPDRWKVVP